GYSSANFLCTETPPLSGLVTCDWIGGAPLHANLLATITLYVRTGCETPSTVLKNTAFVSQELQSPNFTETDPTNNHALSGTETVTGPNTNKSCADVSVDKTAVGNGGALSDGSLVVDGEIITYTITAHH